MVGDGGSGLVVGPAVVPRGGECVVVGVAGVVAACWACPVGSMVVVVVAVVALEVMAFSLLKIPGEMLSARLLWARNCAASVGEPWCTM